MQDYEILRKIGKGSFGNVLLVREKSTNKLFALKKIIPAKEKSPQNSVNPLVEVDVLRSLDHINIIKYYKCFGHKEKLCILMEYADDGDLLQRMSKAQQMNTFIPEKQILHWFAQICLATQHIHEKNIIHRDIKVQNVFLTKTGLIKLGDFGISKILKNQTDFASTSVGTPYYYSPELCTSSMYSYKTDIWMLGCLLYELCAMDRPFPGNSYPEIINKILNEEPKPLNNSQYSPFLRNLIASLLTKDQYKRPGIQEIVNLKEIRQEIEKIQQFYRENCKDNDNCLQVKKKTMSKPVSFGNLPTYSTVYHEINSKKTMTPHFIPQEMLKDFEKNSILSLINKISSNKKHQHQHLHSPAVLKKPVSNEFPKENSDFPKDLPKEKDFSKENDEFAKENPKENARKDLKNLSEHAQVSFETYLQQKLSEFSQNEENKEPSNIYSSFEKREEFAPGNENSTENTHSPVNSAKKPRNPVEMTASLAKPGDSALKNRKKVAFETKFPRGRENFKENGNKFSPKSVSINARAPKKFDWGDWLLEKAKNPESFSNFRKPRTILMLDFIKKRHEKENQQRETAFSNEKIL